MLLWNPTANIVLCHGNEASIGVFAANKLIDLWLLWHVVNDDWVRLGGYSVTTAGLSPQWLLENVITLVDHANLLNSWHWICDLTWGWRLGSL